MLTEDQIKNLNPGDSLVMRGTYIKRYSDGDIAIKCSITSEGELTTDIKHFHPTCVSLPSKDLKYDPCRLFREGDVVELKQVKGRAYSNDSKHLIGKKCIVFRDEEEPGWVVISHEGKNYSINAAYLELVTPIEELEPFYVERQGEKSGGLCYTVRKYDGWVESTFYFGNGRSRDEQQAKTAAEAERARLNAEHKEKYHDLTISKMETDKNILK